MGADWTVANSDRSGLIVLDCRPVWAAAVEAAWAAKVADWLKSCSSPRKRKTIQATLSVKILGYAASSAVAKDQPFAVFPIDHGACWCFPSQSALRSVNKPAVVRQRHLRFREPPCMQPSNSTSSCSRLILASGIPGKSQNKDEAGFSHEWAIERSEQA